MGRMLAGLFKVQVSQTAIENSFSLRLVHDGILAGNFVEICFSLSFDISGKELVSRCPWQSYSGYMCINSRMGNILVYKKERLKS